VEQSLPATADLVIIENMGLQEPTVHEQIAWRLIEHYSTPSHGNATAAGGAGSVFGRRRLQGRLAGKGTLAGRRARGRMGSGGGGGGGGASRSSSLEEGRRPAVILFNTAQLAHPGWDCYYSLVPECCADFRSKVGPDYRTGHSDAAHNTLADYYGFASISHK
jgi:hypothetical protein